MSNLELFILRGNDIMNIAKNKMLKIFSCIIICSFLIFIFTRCSNANTKLTYNQFYTFVESMRKDIKINDYTLSENSMDTQLVAIDKKSSFNKRDYLTLDGTSNSKPTQLSLIYNDDSSQTIIIDFIYLDRELNQDMIFWSFYPKDISNCISEKYDEVILSYKNIIIKISAFAFKDKKLNSEFMTDTVKDVVDLINKNDK